MPVDLFSVSHQSSGSRSAITARRLRATLRLLFDGRTADEIAGATTDGPLDVEVLRAVANRARARYLLERMLRRLPGNRSADDDRPLPASLGVAGGAAVALAFHTGLGLDAGTIAEVQERSPEQVGADLFKARQAIDLSLPVPCERFAATVSMLSDRALDAEERLQYISHAPGCERCPVAVDAMAALDMELRAEVNLHERGLPDAPARRRGPGLLPVAGAVVIAVVAIAGIAVLSGLLSGSREPVPLVSADVPAAYTGWLVQQATDGQIEVVNLATKETHSLGATAPEGNFMRWPVFSPDFDMIAGWLQSPTGPRLEATDLDGTALHAVSFDQTEAFWFFAGWYGDNELLVTSSPAGPPNEQQDDFYARLATESRLLAIDATTGVERVLYQGNVANAYIAPDGTRAIIVHPFDVRWPGGSIELRQMSDEGVGDLITTIEHRVAGTSTGMWAPDSSAFYFARIADEELERLELTPGQVVTGSSLRYEQAELAALNRDGNVTSLWSAEEKTELVVASVSPDSQTVIFRSGFRQTLGYFRAVFWRVTAGGGEPEPFIESPHPSGVWSPDGSTLLWPTVVRSYLAGESTGVAGQEVPDIALVAYGADWAPHTVSGGLEPGPVGARVLAWLPEDALMFEPERVVALQGNAAEPAPVVNAGPGNQIVAGSTASPDGQYVTLRTVRGDMTIWNTERRQGRRLQEGAGGGTWLPNGVGVLETMQPRGSDVANRLIFYAPQFTRETDARYDFRQFDPANLGDGGSASYAVPRMSPGQSNASFYVVDPAQRSVSLWVAGWDTPARQVLRWQVPANRLLDVPLTAVWADERTLLVAQPDDWQAGLPRQVRLTRIVVNGDDVRAEPLVEMGVRPREHGVMIWEMALSPDGSQIAYRLRHFSEQFVEAGRTDVLHVVAVSDIGSPIELARGSPGEGMAWSRDSRWLAAGTRGRIALMSVDGRSFSYISPDGAEAEHPLWISTHELWFTLDTGNGPQIWRVRVD